MTDAHHGLTPFLVLAAPFLALGILTAGASAQATRILGEQKINRIEGGFAGPLDVDDAFGISVTSLGDLDGDGVGDVAVGASGDDDGGFERGAVWILFLHPDRTVKAAQKISQTEGALGVNLNDYDRFGYSVAGLGDQDGDGVVDLAVGAWTDDEGGTSWLADRGAVYVLFLQTDGTVKAAQKIATASGGLVGPLSDGDYFGSAVAALDDLDGDGLGDLAVGARGTDDGGIDRGAVYILFLRANGTVKAEQKISVGFGGFNGTLDRGDDFGNAVAAVGDLDGDGNVELAVGAWRDDAMDPWTDASDYGAVWLLFLHANGTVVSGQYINALSGGFGGTLDEDDRFGASLSPIGDLDGDGVDDLVVGASGDDDGFGTGALAGALWFLFLRPDGTVRSELKISATEGGFGGGLVLDSRFGCGVQTLGDFDGDGGADLVVGAFGDDGGAGLGADYGAIYTLLLQGCPAAAATERNPDVGGHVNPNAYTVPGLPVLGGTFTGAVALEGHGGSFLVGYAAPQTFTTPWGNVLVDTTDPAGELLGSLFATGDPALFDAPLPDDPAWCGIFAATQAIRVGGGVDLTNARDLVLGR